MLSVNEERAIFELIMDEWKSLSEPFAPSGVWIRQYPPVPLELDEIDDQSMFPQAVWFLDRNGLRQEDVWKWRRLLAVRWHQPWCGAVVKEPSGIFGHPYKIGLAAFAPYIASEQFYVETQWGGTYGNGWQVVIDSEGKAQHRKRLWVS